jgi:hypothetical protein
VVFLFAGLSSSCAQREIGVSHTASDLLSSEAEDAIRIEINSSWTGLGASRDNSITITGKGGKYSTDGGKVNAIAVAELLSALADPIVEGPKLEGCGVDEAWLQKNYRAGLKDYIHRKIDSLSLKQVELFRSQFANVTNADTAFAELFKNWHTDDYPRLSVSVHHGQRQYGVQSTSQYPFMLPWVGLDGPRGGYNCRISRALANVIPKDFPNRNRLVVGQAFRLELTEQIMDSIRHDWDLLDTENKVGPQVAPVFVRFKPIESAISNVSSIDLNGTQAWNAKLRSSEFPSNLIFGVSLSYRGKGLNGVDTLLTQVPKYARLVLSVPWLNKYLEDHPDTTFELRYVDGRSLSSQAEKEFAEDMRKHNKAALADAASRQSTEDAFLEINSGQRCWSRAIVLPTKEVLLWHFKCDSVMGLPAKDFDAWDFYGWRSTGTIIGLDGKIVR